MSEESGPVFSFDATCIMCGRARSLSMTQAAFDESMSDPKIVRKLHQCQDCGGYAVVERGLLVPKAEIAPEPRLRGSRLWRKSLAREIAI